MSLQNLRVRMSARLSGEREAGFTLIELLVVMLILGILAAIAIPSFFNQRDKATDAQAKSGARTAQTAIETYATDNSGSYVGATKAKLEGIETTLSDVTLEEPEGLGANEYTVVVKSDTGNVFKITRNAEGKLSHPCTEKGNAGCPESEDWGG